MLSCNAGSMGGGRMNALFLSLERWVGRPTGKLKNSGMALQSLCQKELMQLMNFEIRIRLNRFEWFTLLSFFAKHNIICLIMYVAMVPVASRCVWSATQKPFDSPLAPGLSCRPPGLRDDPKCSASVVGIDMVYTICSIYSI